jgi:hypothetical protein
VKKIIAATLFFISYSTFAFAQSSALNSFIAFPGKGDVNLQWSINPGFSCSGVTVEWSTDSFSFSSIYTYPGVCGASTAILTYQWDHTTPSSSTNNYYRLNLGVFGYSPIISTATGSKKNYLLYPNPFNDQPCKIVFTNPANNPVNMYIFDHNGQLVKKTLPFQGNSVVFYRESLNADLYYFALVTSGGDLLAWGKFYVNDN